MRLAPTSRPAQLGLICAACTLLTLAVYYADWFGHGLGYLVRAEFRFRNVLVRKGRVNPPDPSLMFLAIDEASISLEPLDLDTLFADTPHDSAEFHALSLMAHQWPWPREIYALILDRLFTAGAKVVVFDLLFPKAASGDEAFAAAMDRYRGRVVIGSNFLPHTLQNGVLGWVHTVPADSIVPQTTPMDDRVGYVNFWADDFDEIVRHARFRITMEGIQGRRATERSEVFSSLAARTLTKAGLGALIPPQPDTEHLFRYSGPPIKTYPALSVYQLFVPKYWAGNFKDGASIRDKIVVIGPYGDWAHDEHATPYGSMPGPELHLNAINALLHQAFLSELPFWIEGVIVICCGLLAWALSLWKVGPLVRTLFPLTSVAVAVLLAFAFYNYASLFIPPITPVLVFNLSGGACFVYEFMHERRAKARTRKMLERYVSRDVVKEILDNQASFLNSLVGVRKDITVLFADVRGFSRLAESTDPAKVVTQLNEYLNQMVRIVFAQSGTLDKFIGDAVMAHWGGIRSEGRELDARRAVTAAMTMREALELLNLGWKARGLQPMKFGIGINHGEAIVGNIGSEERMEVSVIGDAVNVASRLEGATKAYRLELFIGESVAPLVRDAFILRSVDLLRVLGREKPIEVFTVIEERENNAPEPAWLAPYERGVQLYRKREFAAAAECFAEALKLQPDDWLSNEYLSRAQRFTAEPPPPDWDGVYVMTGK